LSEDKPDFIDFKQYCEAVPESIPDAVQLATNRFITTRSQRVQEMSDWEDLRQAASDIRKTTLASLDKWLEIFEQNFTASGGHLHWAETASQARQIILDIIKQKNAGIAVKAKSMATEEIGLNHFLEENDIQVYETDLGEFIIQLAGAGPSHIITPAVHMKKGEIAELFRQKLGIDAPDDPIELTRIARDLLREKFLDADVGISGANFLVAESGTLVLVTNEGNGRMCTTLPGTHIAIAGIDKIIPDWNALGILLKLLARSATGQKLSTYTSFITGPRRSEAENGPEELHLIILDNGRSEILRDDVGRDVLKCIRCGCCLNVCPVYQSVGGYAYGWFISGPIGAIFTPQILGTEAAQQLPFASTLCGACVEVCPVKIPITEILLHLRKKVVEGDGNHLPIAPKKIRYGMKAGKTAIGNPRIYRFGSGMLKLSFSFFKEKGWVNRLPPPANRWTKVRPFPVFQARFRSYWKNHLNRQKRDP